ncbi:MAG TPA: DUF5602 domain-containing protein [Hanamia sp.]|nr:DUF5602 domain-containing protein [Hanamia sp.]
MKRYSLFITAALITSAFFAGCKKDSKSGTFYGEKTSVGNGTVRTFVTLNDDRNPETIGYQFTEDMLSGLPDKDDMTNMHILNFPPQAAAAGYDHAELDWNPHGHDPVQIYGYPHFDFHFYIVGTDELAQIIPGPDTVSVNPQYIPKDYVTGVMAVPNMGVHWADTLSSEYQGQKFTTTFIYGFYHGKMLFVEPMITREYLETHPNVTMPVKQPAAFQKSGYYPTKYSIHYDSNKKEYTVALEGLVKH